ncbi:UNVERIFIED_CONTAM: hypothetical protein Sangu_1682700 [Sesamum angustifolium]|uniref:Plastid-targeted protein 2 n=1 Tax=Sesamum angustifolium TaxID=2727405 RepID=A0AAW2MJA3_9LAMI
MAAAAATSSSCICNSILLNSTTNSRTTDLKYSATSTLQREGHCSFLRRSNYLQRSAALRRSVNSPSSHKYLVVRNATPEAAGDLLSLFSSLPGIPGLPHLGDNPWLAGAVGLFVAVPLMVQRLLTLTKEVDMAAQTVEKIADVVGKVADEVDKAAEEIAEALPEGGLKQVVHFVEDLAEETAKDAQKVEDLMDKVEELDDKLEAFLNKQTKSSGEA